MKYTEHEIIETLTEGGKSIGNYIVILKRGQIDDILYYIHAMLNFLSKQVKVNKLFKMLSDTTNSCKSR